MKCLFEFGTFLVSIISFLIVFLLIRHWAFAPLARMMEKRRLYVEQQLSEAEGQREQAVKLASEQSELLEASRKQARDMIDHARLRAEEQAREILEGAQAEAERIMEQGRELVERERQEAINAVLAQVSSLTVQISEKLLRDHASEALHEELIQEADKRLGELVC